MKDNYQSSSVHVWTKHCHIDIFRVSERPKNILNHCHCHHWQLLISIQASLHIIHGKLLRARLIQSSALWDRLKICYGWLVPHWWMIFFKLFIIIFYKYTCLMVHYSLMFMPVIHEKLYKIACHYFYSYQEESTLANTTNGI